MKLSFGSMRERIGHLRGIDGSRDPKAYALVLDALESAAREAVERAPASDSVSWRELQGTIRLQAAGRFGCQADKVLARWGIRGPADLAEMLFNLTSLGVLAVEDGAVGEDFSSAGDFEDLFDLRPMIAFDWDRREWTVRYVVRRCAGD